MLVLTRKVGEKVQIGDDTVITVVEVNRGKVRLGIQAPGHVPILRREIYARVHEENVASAGAGSEDLLRAARLFQEKGWTK